MDETPDEPLDERTIAIIGIACRLPGAATPAQFWDNLCRGVEALRRLSPAEARARGASEALLADPRFVPVVAAPEGYEEFDAGFFGFSPREAEVLDPQQRLLLECAFECFEDAGYDPTTLPASAGVFAGATTSTYLLYNLLGAGARAVLDPLQLLVGNAVDSLCTRVSYKLGLRGPSYTVQSACSTSLLAVHVACQSLLNGECDVALAGGVSLNVGLLAGYRYEEGSILSPDGHVRAFDAQAAGTVFGGGAGLVLLKPLRDALAAGDHVYALVRGSAVNNDGAAKVGYTAPSAVGQGAVIAEALAASGVEPETVSYVEAHGTATNLGDPVELQALASAFGPRPGRCALGTVKTNVGHLDVAAGVVGLIKTALALRHGRLPASLHYHEPNPRLELGSRFYVNAETCDWPRVGGPRRAGVSSFGFGGTNVHAVLEEAPAARPSGPSARPCQLLVLSARSQAALRSAAARLGEALVAKPDTELADVAFTLACGRRAFAQRAALVAESAVQAAIALGAPESGLWSGGDGADLRQHTVFLFPGQGAQYTGMGRGLYASEPRFRAEADRCCELLAHPLGRDLRALLLAPAPAGDTHDELTPTLFAQTSLFVVEYALARLLMAWGIEPQAMLGHSAGEYVAACLAGVFSLEDALRLVAARGRLMAGAPRGGMLAVRLTPDELREHLVPGLELAAQNAPAECVLAGPLATLEALERRLAPLRVGCARLRTSHAFHSSSMDVVLEPFEAELRRVRLHAPRIPYLSNLTGTWIRPEQAQDPGYWTRHLRETVRLSEGFIALSRLGPRAWLEVGPGHGLCSLARRHGIEGALPTMRGPRDAGSDDAALLRALGRLWVGGQRLDWTAFYADDGRQRVPLPTYPFERTRHWIDAPAASRDGQPPVGADTPGWHARPSLSSSYVAPRDGLEGGLAALWRELLGVEPIGVFDDFFELGGQSLLATQLAARLRTVFEVELPLRALLEARTIAALAPRVAALRATQAPAAVAVQRGAGPRPLSFAQRRLWFLEQLTPGLPVYTIPYAARLRGALDVGALEGALAAVVERHEVLRSAFVAQGHEPLLVAAAARPGLDRLDLTSVPAESREAELRRRALEEARAPFDLAHGPLLRARLLELGEQQHVLLLTLHHAVADGWSLGVLLRELQQSYAAWGAGREPALPPLALQYADYAAWQREWLQGDEARAQLTYWRERLAGDLAPLELPTDRARPAVQSFRGAWHELHVPQDVVSRLKRLGQSDGATLVMVLLAAFQALLGRSTGQDDVRVGAPIAGRGRDEWQGLIGLFVNTLVLRTSLAGDPTLRELLGRVRETALGAYAHQELPFERLVEELHPQRDLSRNPLFQALFVSQGSALPDAALPGLDVQPVEIDNGTSKFDLTLTVLETADGLRATFEYATDLFDAPSIARLGERLRALLEALAQRPDQRLSEVELLTRDERRRLLMEWGQGARLAPHPDECLHDAFEAQARLTPDALALVCGDEQWSYGRLDRRANHVARRLRALGVGPESRVGLSARRRPELLAAILGVLKAGAAYVPLDPLWPRERVAFMLRDSGAEVVLAHRDTLEGLDLSALRVVALDDEATGESAVAPPRRCLPRNLAYVIYTSGSTGRPKGVAVEHHSAALFARWAREAFGPDELRVVLFCTSICFDLSIFEVFASLGGGGCVLLARDALELPVLARREQVTLINTVPSAMAELVRQGALPASVRTVNLCGEPLLQALADSVWAGSRASRLVNLYGPTEDTVYTTWAEVSRGSAPPAIGRPVAGEHVYVLDRNGQLALPGVPGELFIGGDGLARGYLGRPELTAERFVPDPLGPPGARCYRTGDLVRHRPDGELQFLGRLDQQVKVRGFRVELGEIESRLLELPGVRAAAVVAREAGPGDTRLVAYLALPAGTALELGDLRAFLKQRLPEYMLPSALVTLEALPLTPSGKLDRRALPAPAAAGLAGTSDAPRSPLEAELCALWAEVLGLERVGVHADFFALGGHSLLATQVASRVREQFQVDLSLRQFFEGATVADLAEAIGAARLAAAGDEQLEALVAQVRGLSQDELERALAHEDASLREDQLR